jgi:predicted nucleotidyltransferase
MDIEEITRRISNSCSGQSAISGAYIFGSAAKGKEHSSSDIDVGLLLDEARLEDFALLSFVSSLERACGTRVDVVVLNRADEVLKYEIRRSGRLVFERDANHRKQFEIKGRKTYEDFLYLHRRYTGAVLYGRKHG